ncbi:MAG: hypothetical protein AAFZ74_01955 [Pseudomonadota bacterium]
MIKWQDLPEAERQRLHKNEVSNRSRVRAKGLPVLPVSVEGLWLIQRGMCPCNVCQYKRPLEVGKIVIAHKDFTSGKRSPGHVPSNVELWREECNQREAPSETSGFHKGNRFTPDSVSISEKRDRKAKPKSKIQSRGFSKTHRKKMNGDVIKC